MNQPVGTTRPDLSPELSRSSFDRSAEGCSEGGATPSPSRESDPPSRGEADAAGGSPAPICEACAVAETNPKTGLVVSECKECIARSLAGSPAYWDSMAADALTPAYRSALRYFYGAEWVKGHAMVKAWRTKIEAVAA